MGGKNEDAVELKNRRKNVFSILIVSLFHDGWKKRRFRRIED